MNEVVDPYSDNLPALKGGFYGLEDNTRLFSTAHYDFNKPSVVTVIGEPDEWKGVLRVY